MNDDDFLAHLEMVEVLETSVTFGLRIRDAFHAATEELGLSPREGTEVLFMCGLAVMEDLYGKAEARVRIADTLENTKDVFGPSDRTN